ncbi:MAG: hypothetical protein GQ532_04800 [Methylomarinum sp.]|nr:hypothetical protein [Methylomarinum sp.]
MAKINPFEKFSEEYDEWFEKNTDKYTAELHALEYFIPANTNGLEIGVGSEKILQQADDTLYKSKSNGRNQVRLFRDND